MIRNNTVPINNDNFTLTCDVTGPYDSIFWMKDNMYFNMTDSIAEPYMSYKFENNTLHFTPVTLSNEGTYQCVAINLAGEHKSPNYMLLVNCEWFFGLSQLVHFHSFLRKSNICGMKNIIIWKSPRTKYIILDHHVVSDQTHITLKAPPREQPLSFPMIITQTWAPCWSLDWFYKNRFMLTWFKKIY